MENERFSSKPQTTRTDKEMEADRFAQDFLIPPVEYQSFVRTQQFGLENVRQFANRLGISPGIVVGRLQHDGKIPYSKGNVLKRRFKFSES